MKKEIKIILLGNPISNNHIYKTHGHIVYLSKEGKDLKEQYQWQAKAQYKGEPLLGRLKVSVDLYFGDKRKRDIDNFGKLWQDSFNGIVWLDDSQIEKITIEKHYDKNSPRVEIII